MKNDRDVIRYLKENTESFSKQQKILSEYILAHYDKAAYMTASQLGKSAGVSESTVVRFASLLGFDGYQELSKNLRIATRNQLNSLQRMELASERIDSDDILSSVLKSDANNLLNTFREIDKKQFNDAVEALINAENIYITGVRSAAALASFTGFYFNLLFDNVKLINTNGADDIYEQLLRVNEKDAVLGMSFPRYSKNTVGAMEYASKCGATVIGITDHKKSPIVKFSKYCLIAGSDTDSFVDSLVAPLSVVNAIIIAVGMKKKEKTADTFKKLEKIWTEYEVYDKE